VTFIRCLQVGDQVSVIGHVGELHALYAPPRPSMGDIGGRKVLLIEGGMRPLCRRCEWMVILRVGRCPQVASQGAVINIWPAD
jgi:hypothetical protein